MSDYLELHKPGLSEPFTVVRSAITAYGRKTQNTGWVTLAGSQYFETHENYAALDDLIAGEAED